MTDLDCKCASTSRRYWRSTNILHAEWKEKNCGLQLIDIAKPSFARSTYKTRQTFDDVWYTLAIKLFSYHQKDTTSVTIQVEPMRRISNRITQTTSTFVCKWMPVNFFRRYLSTSFFHLIVKSCLFHILRGGSTSAVKAIWSMTKFRLQHPSPPQIFCYFPHSGK